MKVNKNSFFFIKFQHIQTAFKVQISVWINQAKFAKKLVKL